jgi:hypothetical protein
VCSCLEILCLFGFQVSSWVWVSSWLLYSVLSGRVLCLLASCMGWLVEAELDLDSDLDLGLDL